MCGDFSGAQTEIEGNKHERRCQAGLDLKPGHGFLPAIVARGALPIGANGWLDPGGGGDIFRRADAAAGAVIDQYDLAAGATHKKVTIAIHRTGFEGFSGRYLVARNDVRLGCGLDLRDFGLADEDQLAALGIFRHIRRHRQTIEQPRGGVGFEINLA